MGLFHRRRKTSSMSTLPSTAEMVSLRVLVDSGPAAREIFSVNVPAEADVDALRSAIAAQIGITSMSMFKVSIPWHAHYQACAYVEQYATPASLLPFFPAYNLDDATELGAAGGPALNFPSATGSLRSRRNRWASYRPTIHDWYPAIDADAINVLARTASSSNLDWARPQAPAPITLAARFTTSSMGGLEVDAPVLVDVSPDATVAELKVALLLAAGRPAPAGHLNNVVLWHVDADYGTLAELDRQGKLLHGRPPVSTTPLRLDNGARVADLILSSSRAAPERIQLSAWIRPVARAALAPRTYAPPFSLASPAVQFVQEPRLLAPLPLPLPADAHGAALEWPSPPSSPSARHAHSTLSCCTHHDGAPLIGLGITMSPSLSCASDHTYSDEEASWPPTPQPPSEEWTPAPMYHSFGKASHELAPPALAKLFAPRMY